MTYYTTDGCLYEGMDQDTIIILRKELGKDTVFVDETAFNSIIQTKKTDGL